MKYKMICIDMDGTLLGKGRKISKVNKEAVKKAHDLGVEIVVTTGRIYNNAAYFSKLLGVDSPVIAANGAIIIDQKTNDIIYESVIPYEDCLNLLDVLYKSKLSFQFYTTDTIYCSTWLTKTVTKVYNTKQEIEEHQHLNIDYHVVKTKDEWKKVLNRESGKIAKCIVFSFKKKNIDSIREELEYVNNITLYSAGNHSLEVNYKDVSKGNAVRILIEKYGIGREELVCIGDNHNDISMIEFAGLGIAMGNGIDEVKNVAQAVTDTNKNDGVGKAINKFILHNQQNL